MRKTKKLLCVLLAMVIMLPNIALFNTVFAQATDEEPLQIEVTTDKDSYNAWGIANITVTVTNTSDEAVNDIKAEAIFEQLAPVGKNNETYKEISSLQPDESFTFSYQATVNSKNVKINFFEKIFLWFVRLFNSGYTAESHNIEADIENVTEINFGKYVVENVIWVCSEINTPNIAEEEKAISAFTEYFDIKNDVNSIDDDYEDENGYIPQEDVEEVLKQVAEYAEQKLQQGLIKEYGLEIDNNCVWIDLKNGIHFVYTPNVQGIDSVDISTYQPCLFTYEKDIQEMSIASVDGSAQKIENRIDDYDFLNNYDNQKITLDTIKNIEKNEVVIWHGHGHYDTKIHSALMTSIMLDEIDFLLDPIYYLSKIGYTSDYLNGRIACTSSGYVLVTAKFIEHYLGDLSNTFVYLGTCSSGADSVLPNAFINKGAEAVVANTGVIHTVYNLAMIKDVCGGMTETSTKTNKYYTLGESLNTAKEKNGEVCCSTHFNTEVRIWGNSNYRYTDKEKTTYTASVHGTVVDKDSGMNISNVKVSLYSETTQKTLTTVTNSSGAFEFENLAAGNYTVSFEHTDYKTDSPRSIKLTDGLMFVYTDPIELTKKNSSGEDGGEDNNELVPDPNRTVISSGNCGANGDNVKYVVYEDGELVIYGSGKMADYSYSSSAPWYSYSSSIKTVVIYKGVTSIGNRAFDWCESLTSVTIPDSVTSIGDHAFISCDSLTSITIPDSVTSIGDYAFIYCDSLTSITIPNSVTNISSYTFSDCTSLTSVTIPNSVTSIGDTAFARCKSLTSITIPNSVTSIDSWAFIGCGFTSITIPNSVKTIGRYAFWGCDSLTSITFGKNSQLTSIGADAFLDCTSLTSITIPNSVTSIGTGAFFYCFSLTTVTFGKNSRLTSIGNSAFASCINLTSITIPNSVKTIDECAFAYCESLTDVYYGGSKEEWNNIDIGNYNTYLTNATIHYNS